MASNPVYILYKVVNSDSDRDDPCFNAFPMSGGGRPTLASVKQNCAALYGMNHLGPEGYHWRVCVEDKQAPGETSPKTFSWWDIQDESASLPIKEASQYQLNKFFGPPEVDHSDVAKKAAQGAFKTLGKAMSQAVGRDDDDVDQGPRVKVVAFKLLDLVKLQHDYFATKNHGRGRHIPHLTPPLKEKSSRARVPHGTPRPLTQKQQQQQPPRRQQVPPQPRRTQQQPTRQSEPAPQANLMDFGTAPSTSTSNGSKTLHHALSMPVTTGSAPRPPSDETRAEKLKREYTAKKHTAQLVFDKTDQRWVEVNKEPSSYGGQQPPKKKEVGIFVTPSSGIGTSTAVRDAKNRRYNDMKKAQEDALQEVREREEKKKREEAEEGVVRKRLEPQIKAWSEEHGKKKQLHALLATLHTILWPGAKWKQVTIGDILADKKVKRAFYDASIVLHPDKTHHLDAERRFLAKRIFDALSQAKTEFDNGKK